MDSELWQRLDAFSLDDPTSSLSFSQRLARDQGWTLGFALRAGDEYKRFVYLSQVADHPVCPSEEVDEVWHLHLCYTRSYWDEMCQGVLGRALHHEPTKGGQDQGEYHRKIYQQTLDSYVQFFECEPPSDIWPAVDARFRRPRKESRWRPRLPFTRPNRRTIWTGAGLLAIAPLLQMTLNPMNMPGPQFIVFYICMMLFGVFIGWLAPRLFEPSSEGEAPVLSPVEAAVLSRDGDFASQVALANLLAEGTIVVANSVKQQLEVKTPLGKQHSKLDEAIYGTVAQQRKTTVTQAIAGGRFEVAKIRSQLVDKGLLNTPAASVASFAGGGWLLLLSILGLSKFIKGASRGYPVVYLFVALVVTFTLMGYFFLKRRRRTNLGEYVMKRLNVECNRLQFKNPDKLKPAQISMVMAVLGLAAMSQAHPDIAALDRWLTAVRSFNPRGQEGGSSWWGGSCSSGCSAGCGSGCGGGCGGCGN